MGLREDVSIRQTLNACVFSPTKEHVLLGGGQDAMSVTTTAGRQGRFETQFYHLAYEEEFGRVKGHFGPINALAISPLGKSCSGAEDATSGCTTSTRTIWT